MYNNLKCFFFISGDPPSYNEVERRGKIGYVHVSQWRIQDSPDGDAPTSEFGKIFAENCMKIKEIRPREGVGCP